MKTFITKNIDETRNWAREFAKTLRQPMTIALHGDLGVGKSEIARTIIQTLCGADTVVPSPTFTLVQTYIAGDTKISHFDLYRISDVAELVEIGLGHAVQNDITLIEWPDIASDMLPNDTVHIDITELDDGRKITIR
ncbi:MAG: tRNA (adenosine(37)-N6)-threonylcarbamoyltransferase complex ATPase subunit type 1 TsaE [Alphaproteobacteria bacterium]|nr:tRNA (adenosine(37)-N6)-threonylcarbamoyltransferase complex ATPase subunit type 1 TsaE [Alphaproteobacteria bacterium]MBR4806651.1 tRNA (adenosine(37)-N6)-threonylcarbamoyltransferase complex ATPase subunit type 1 TsaE [Alphaproteobacteria bacterium]